MGRFGSTKMQGKPFEDPMDKSKQIGGKHYIDSPIQPWDVMAAMSGIEPDRFNPFQWHLLFTALKYLMRAGKKGPAEVDIDKAIHYLKMAVAIEEPASNLAVTSSILNFILPLIASLNI